MSTNLKEGKQQDKLAKKILIVDDDESIAWMLGVFLGTKGFHCTLATSVDEARNHLHSAVFDVIISDLHIGSGSGMDLLRNDVSNGSGTAFILITANDDSETRRMALKSGALAYLIKPLDFGKLLSIVAGALQYKASIDKRQLCNSRPPYIL